jgi:hypothetical protein
MKPFEWKSCTIIREDQQPLRWRAEKTSGFSSINIATIFETHFRQISNLAVSADSEMSLAASLFEETTICNEACAAARV